MLSAQGCDRSLSGGAHGDRIAPGVGPAEGDMDTIRDNRAVIEAYPGEAQC
ncbi:MAG: hypothetical protein LBR82_06805 [Desulfovibrio sp.]|jgi:hypothetical protein|nr:hypothetical protein [Desulfovibrio sp.]